MAIQDEQWKWNSKLMCVRDAANSGEEVLRLDSPYNLLGPAVSAAPDMARMLLRMKWRIESQTGGISPPPGYSADYDDCCALLKRIGALP